MLTQEGKKEHPRTNLHKGIQARTYFCTQTHTPRRPSHGHPWALYNVLPPQHIRHTYIFRHAHVPERARAHTWPKKNYKAQSPESTGETTLSPPEHAPGATVEFLRRPFREKPPGTSHSVAHMLTGSGPKELGAVAQQTAWGSGVSLTLGQRGLGSGYQEQGKPGQRQTRARAGVEGAIGGKPVLCLQFQFGKFSSTGN